MISSAFVADGRSILTLILITDTQVGQSERYRNHLQIHQNQTETPPELYTSWLLNSIEAFLLTEPRWIDSGR
jgi:hypothetical protein